MDKRLRHTPLDPDRDALIGKTLRLPECGCIVEGAGTLPNPVQIVFCSFHDNVFRAVEKALALLDDADEQLAQMHKPAALSRAFLNAGRRVLMDAAGRPPRSKDRDADGVDAPPRCTHTAWSAQEDGVHQRCVSCGIRFDVYQKIIA